MEISEEGESGGVCGDMGSRGEGRSKRVVVRLRLLARQRLFLLLRFSNKDELAGAACCCTDGKGEIAPAESVVAAEEHEDECVVVYIVLLILRMKRLELCYLRYGWGLWRKKRRVWRGRRRRESLRRCQTMGKKELFASLALRQRSEVAAQD